MKRKRGVMLLGIVIFLLALVSVFVLGVESDLPTSVEPARYLIIGGKWDSSECDDDSDSVNIEYKIKEESKIIEGDDTLDKIDFDGEDTDCQPKLKTEFETVPKLANNVDVRGCWLVVAEDDGEDEEEPDFGDDDGAWGVVKPGNIIGRSASALDLADSGQEEEWFNECEDTGINSGNGLDDILDDGDTTQVTQCHFKNPSPLLCSSDGFWYECKEETLGSRAFVEDDVYDCTENDDVFDWDKIAEDKDRDGYLTEATDDVPADCNDRIESSTCDNELNDVNYFKRQIRICENANDLLDRCENSGNDCSEIEEETDDCTAQDYSAQAVVAAAALTACEEINEDLIELCQEVNDAETPELKKEICNGDPALGVCAACINPEAREVCGDAVDNDCNDETARVNAENPAQECNFFKEGCEATQKINPETNTAEGVTHTNIYEKSFSWIDTAEGGYCCGFNGMEDLGKVEQGTESTQGNFLCVNNNPDLVGYAGASSDEAGSTTTPPGWGRTAKCEGENNNWCWISAFGDAAFKILTIKKFSDKPYDVVSNGQKWVECREGEGTKGIAIGAETSLTSSSSESGSASITARANGFYCYQEEGHGAWAECLEGDASASDIKKRSVGDGLFALRVRDEGTSDNRKFIELGNRADFYGTSSISTEGYGFLEFMLQFPEAINYPADVVLHVQGPVDDEGNHQEYLQRNILGDIVNKGALETNHWLHVKVPLPETGLLGVENVFLQSENNKIFVKSFFLSNDDTPRLCSGERGSNLEPSNTEDNSRSTWVEDIDFFQTGLLSGESLCNLYYSKGEISAWMGGEEIPVQRNCCGDDSNEYYNGAESTSACWNSQVLSQGDTAMNVEANIGYMKEKVEIEYPEIEIEFDFDRGLTFDGYDEVDNFFNNVFDDADANHNFKKIYLLDFLSPKKEIWSFSPADIPESTTDLVISLEGYDSDDSNGYNDGIGRISLAVLPNDIKNKNIAIRSSVKSSTDTADYALDTLFSSNIATLYFEDADTRERLPDTINFADENLPKKITLIAELVGEPQIVNFEDVDFDEPDNNKLSSQEIALYIDGDSDDSPPGIHAYPIIKKVTPVDPSPSATFSFPCTSTECTFPLPGKPPYTLSNPHPELYDLYFIYKDLTTNEVKEELVTTDYTNDNYGNLIARRVPQQVLFVKEVGIDHPESGFYSCNALSEIESDIVSLSLGYDNLLITEQSVCSVFNLGGVGDALKSFFCAPSVRTEEGVTLMNSWSSEPILSENLGYVLPTSVDASGVDPTPTQVADSLSLGRTEEEVQPHERVQQAEAIPARNLLSNAVFKITSEGLSGWTLRNAEGKEITDNRILESTYVTEYTGVIISEPTSDTTPLGESTTRDSTVLLPDEQFPANKVDLSISGETLRSEPIAVPDDVVLELTVNNEDEESTCGKIKYFTQDGTEATESSPPSFVVVEFTVVDSEPCTIHKPMLQIVDKSAVPYNFKELPEISPFVPKPRSALACCPAGYCWNGYACIAPFDEINYPEEYTYIVDYIADGTDDGRNYRCFDGQWKDMPPKKDWNYQKQGFCEESTQCFVLSSRVAEPTVTGSNPWAQKKTEALAEGEIAKTLFHDQTDDFKLPACINASDYILDHYCELGTEAELADEDLNNDAQWTSRTKFLAADLLKVGEDSGEYSLYCTTPELALLET
ncbi:hypothetical protein HYX13_01220, partial [Candidatus Woesearchaeota archaeon]|nr:hypothetical protein [Candidatus Woesearchaeota archaeon]